MVYLEYANFVSVVGEAPVSTGACVLFALKRAVEAARAEQNSYDWFPFRKFMLSFRQQFHIWSPLNSGSK